jgi:hypothetical protein
MPLGRIRLLSSTILALVATPALAAPDAAQDAGKDQAQSSIADIVVTAERRVSSTQKTALNITALAPSNWRRAACATAARCSIPCRAEADRGHAQRLYRPVWPGQRAGRQMPMR